MVPGDMVVFNSEVRDMQQMLIIARAGYTLPVLNQTLATVAWVGQSKWNPGGDLRLVVRLEEYGELEFAMKAWRLASEEDLSRLGYYAEYTIVSSTLHQ
jgi:hypothetical protein